MKNPDQLYQPHLGLEEIFLRPGTEWTPPWTSWTMIHVTKGVGYYLRPESNQDLETGSVLLTTGLAVTLRASNLGALSLHAFSVMPNRLTGLLTLNEQEFFRAAAQRNEPKILPPQSPITIRMRELCAKEHQTRLLFRLNLFHLFVEAFNEELDQPTARCAASEARERLRAFLAETPSSELLEMSFDDIAQMINCTSRHLSRIFRELVGKSFREKRMEIRLARARELLATSNSKVVDVAMESGYKSLSLFNLMFSRRFGTSPGKWRQQHIRETRSGKATRKTGRVRANSSRGIEIDLAAVSEQI